MSIKYKLFLSFFLMTSLFLVGVVIRFFEIHRTRKLVDKLKPAVSAEEDPHVRLVKKARAMLQKVPMGKADPRMAATVFVLDLVVSLRQSGEHAVGLAGASLMEDDGKLVEELRKDMKRFLTLSDILGAQKATDLAALPEVKARLEGDFARVKIDPACLVEVLRQVPPEIRAATSDLTMQQLAEGVVKHRGILAKSGGALHRAAKSYVNFRREVDSVTADLRKAEAGLTHTVVANLNRDGVSELSELRAFIEDEHAGIRTAAVDEGRSEEDSPLKILLEKLYGYQLREAAYSISLFAVSFVLAIILTVLVYRDIVQPMAIIRNGLNNLAMGGDKKRINLRIHNEMGQIIESYNRLVDNMTSDVKRLVECPSCRNMYEMGDCFCKQCGRKLRFDG